MSRIAMIITTTTQPGRRDDVRARYEGLLAPKAEENAAQPVVVWCDDDGDADTFHLFEIYEHGDALAANAGAPWFADYMAQVAPMLAGEPTVRMTTTRWTKGV